MDGLNFVAIDFETANAQRSSACSIGLAFVENGELVDSKHYFIKPTPNHYAGYNISIHGITNADTDSAPTFAELWGIIRPSIEGQLLSFHFSSFDVSVLRSLFREYSIEPIHTEYVCSYAIAHKAFPDLKKHKLKTVCKHIGHNIEQHHNAEHDAIAAAAVLVAEVRSCGASSIDEMLISLGIKKGILSPDLYRPCSRAVPHASKQRVTDATVDPDTINKENPLYEKEVVFTGAISVVRAKAQQTVVNLGGVTPESLRKTTNYLVCGVDQIRGSDLSTGKLKQATAFNAKGSDIEIITEDEFWEIVSWAESF